MWKYKTLMLMVIGAVVIALIIDLMTIFSIYPDMVTLKILEFINTAGQMFCVYTLIVVLNKHHETIWRKVPFYLLILCKIISYYIIPALTKWIKPSLGSSLPSHNLSLYTTLMGVIGFFFIALYIYMLISCFNVKDDVIAPYFKLYGWFTIMSVVGIVVMQMVHIMHWRGGYVTLMRDIVLSLPILVTIWMLYKLYDRQEHYIPGDIISTIREIENVPAGTNGTIIKNHGSNYYEVEFIDDKGNLLNELSVSSDDFERAIAPDLETKVENFGSNLN